MNPIDFLNPQKPWRIPLCVGHHNGAKALYSDHSAKLLVAYDADQVSNVADQTDWPMPDGALTLIEGAPDGTLPMPPLPEIHQQDCRECNGTGKVLDECLECEGTGDVECPHCGQDMTCDECGGNGYSKIKTGPCAVCAGTGKVDQECVQLGAGHIATRYYRWLAAQPGVMFTSPSKDHEYYSFTWLNGKAIAMPFNPRGDYR